MPNILTFSRFIIAPAIGYAIVHDAHAWALGMFAYAGVSDLLDGWIARRWKLQTVVGSIVDPMADKLLMTILTVSLAVQGSLPGKSFLTLDVVSIVGRRCEKHMCVRYTENVNFDNTKSGSLSSSSAATSASPYPPSTTATSPSRHQRRLCATGTSLCPRPRSARPPSASTTLFSSSASWAPPW